MAEFVLKVQDIDDRGKDYEFPLTAEWLDHALSETPLRRDPAAREGQFTLHAQRNGQDVLVRGELDADLLVECSRCLGDTKVHVHAPLTALLSPGSDALPEEVELSAEDLDRTPFAGNEIVLDEIVREHIVLECPMQPLCSDACPGIEIPEHVRPPVEDFGGGGKVDPRLAPLEQLRGKLSGNKE